MRGLDSSHPAGPWLRPIPVCPQSPPVPPPSSRRKPGHAFLVPLGVGTPHLHKAAHGIHGLAGHIPEAGYRLLHIPAMLLQLLGTAAYLPPQDGKHPYRGEPARRTVAATVHGTYAGMPSCGNMSASPVSSAASPPDRVKGTQTRFHPSSLATASTMPGDTPAGPPSPPA